MQTNMEKSSNSKLINKKLEHSASNLVLQQKRASMTSIYNGQTPSRRRSIHINGRDEAPSLPSYANNVRQRRLSSRGSMTHIQEDNQSPKEVAPINVEGINSLLNVNHLTPTKLLEQKVKVRSAIQNIIESTISQTTYAEFSSLVSKTQGQKPTPFKILNRHASLASEIEV